MKSTTALRRLHASLLKRTRAGLTTAALGLRPLRTPATPDMRVVVWPPAETPDELGDVLARVQCLVPRTDLNHPIVVTARPSADAQSVQPTGGSAAIPPAARPRIDIRVAVGDDQWRAAARHAHVWLIRRFSASRLATLLVRRPEFYLIDPALYLMTEGSEWRMFYERHHDVRLRQDLVARSSRNFQSFVERHLGSPVNICGNGPGLSLFSDDGRGVNVVCNAAVLSPAMARRLKPSAIPIDNQLYFGPSQLARSFMDHVCRWVEEFDAYVFVREGYEHYITASNYPQLEHRLIGLRTVDALVVPSPERQEIPATNNIATSMMIPIALSLSPPEMRFWGCDGRKPEQRTGWSHLRGLEPDVRGAVHAHPAYFRDHRMTAPVHDEWYFTHCRTMERAVELAERLGVRVVSSSPSEIPALRERSAPPVIPVEAVQDCR